MIKQVLLSFDIEEFDMPLEYRKSIPLDEQISVSREGTKIILDLLLQYRITATFFSTVTFANHAVDLIHRIKKENHELASHGYFHSRFQNEHLFESKRMLEKISGGTVQGFRMPRMMPVNNEAIKEAGYLYNSSLNPTYLPGRYNNLSKPRILHQINETLQLPASTTPNFRFPLFWLSFHNMPLWIYKAACIRTINYDHYLNIYFHPWEFTDLTKPSYGLPGFVTKNSGAQMTERFENWIKWMKKRGYHFSTIQKYLSTKENNTM